MFANCANELRERDYKYFQCTILDGADPCAMLRDLHAAKDARKYVLALVPFVFSSAAILVNVVYGAIIIYLWRTNKLSSKHRYAFLLSRTLSTIIALFLFYVILLAWKFGGFEYTSATIFIIIASITLLTLAGTYLAMTWILYVAVVHPLEYRYFVTMSKCWAVIIAIWIISIAFALCTGLLGATLFYPETAPFNCPFDSCQRPFAFVVTCVMATFMITVIAFYMIMLWRMHRRKFDSQFDSRSQRSFKSSNIRAMNRLALNLITFTVGSLPIVVVAIIATTNLRNLASLGLGVKSSCKTFVNARLFMQVEILACVAATVWSITMVLDPLINLYVDPVFTDTLRFLWQKFPGCNPKRVTSSDQEVVISPL
ncbi:Putative G-protein coupled receptor [Toxocara canis]|uniref:Putative G-protein coupled receptor n=1 Tax=Toxocara canis TaxID=6265 RepID=A0A0B2V392_TOXCA|nr:Putative G-protein coupled receptor [Toxocara canis]